MPSQAKNQTLILTSGNDGQMIAAVRLMQQLRDSTRGKYKGEFLIVSDALSEESRKLLADFGIAFLVLSPDELEPGKSQLSSDKHPFGKVGKPFIIRAALRRQAVDKTSRTVMYLDPDVMVQRPIQPVLDRVAPDRLLIFAEPLGMHNNPWCASQLARHTTAMNRNTNDLEPIKEEVNTGIMIGPAKVIVALLDTWCAFMMQAEMRQFSRSDANRDNAWHDQDYFRCFLRTAPRQQVRIASDSDVVHLCADGWRHYRFIPWMFSLYHRTSWRRPTLVHLAGATHQQYESLSRYYDPAYATLEFAQFRAIRTVPPCIAVFGTGQGADAAMPALTRHARIDAFIDNNPEKWKQRHHGRPILSPSEAAGKDFDYIVTASIAHQAMHKQLHALGVPKNRILSIQEPLLSAFRTKRTQRRNRLLILSGVFTVGLLLGMILQYLRE